MAKLTNGKTAAAVAAPSSPAVPASGDAPATPKFTKWEAAERILNLGLYILCFLVLAWQMSSKAPVTVGALTTAIMLGAMAVISYLRAVR